ncbi:hypothetical protein GCM10010218_36000 [Streptomyces mashuensis]|uniref:Putative restriction endonuclease domain-containing protein n=1 Tax=Streptomyces mashuensis TaxID=33904 RepID=A0A919B3Z9_9ACTN|nr:Uma2 family endonuclease [Streptomyces mashuensis]GHF51253.1 hypothetical protein GCM10010218_36000 [Streptomyces mashuensis]
MTGHDPELEEMFELLYSITPELFHSEIVGGAICMVPKRNVHSVIVTSVFRQLMRCSGPGAEVVYDVRLDLPGWRNAFAPDVYKLSAGARPDARGEWRYQDVEFVLEVITRGTAENDYGKKKDAYAAGEIPVYLIADPYTGECQVHTDPRDGAYQHVRTVPFGEKVDLTDTVVGMTLETDRFPRD